MFRLLLIANCITHEVRPAVKVLHFFSLGDILISVSLSLQMAMLIAYRQ